MTETLDSKDRQLIHFLEIDGRASISQIAKKIGVSKEVANYRLHRLLKVGIIKRFVGSVNQFAYGQGQYRVLMRVEKPDEFVAQNKRKMNYMARVRKLSHWNVDFAIWAKNNSEFKKLFNEICENTNVDLVKILVVDKRYTLLHAYLFGEQESLLLERANNEVDAIDQKIIGLLIIDGRMQTTQIAKECGISAVAVAKRISSLVKNKIIPRIRVSIDNNKIGYDSYQIHIQFLKKDDLRRASSWLCTKKQVTGLRELIGDFDLEFVADFSNARELAQFTDELEVICPCKNIDIALL